MLSSAHKENKHNMLEDLFSKLHNVLKIKDIIRLIMIIIKINVENSLHITAA